ncbi:uncharacterized protein LOC143360446 [Halictus rubicundus]|uniref:uncharacterized protein LOC143360446 n=1 Tax=Halictus rubicundus TaxID=77578 RepID=UPI0040366ED9
MPRLRKDRGPKTRWGVQYYAAVRNAVFMIRTPPYVPPEPPPSLNNHDTESGTLYMCPQCKDRFHFRSSLEDHSARKSWILGYWCQHCFVTVCTHDTKDGSMCSACSKLEREKRTYLRNKGLHKTHKVGAVQLFFNQCQFLAHVKAHSITNVNMSDLMLMPIPTNLTQNWDPEINTTCKAIMEHTFITKVHIMDWLKNENVDSNWWQITSKKSKSEHDLIASILKDYKGRQYFKPLEIPMEEQICILNNKSVPNLNSKCIEIMDAPENTEKIKNPPSVDTPTFVSDDNEIENEDTPCTMNDIAFVDCGPTSNHFEPEGSTNNLSKKQVMSPTRPNRNYSIVPHMTNLVINKSKRMTETQWKSISSDMVMSYGNTMITPRFDTKDSPKTPANKKSTRTVADRSSKCSTPIKLITESNTVGKGGKNTTEKNLLVVEPLSKVLPDASSCTSKTDKAKLEKLKQNASVVTVNSGQKYVTFHNTLHIDINTIINQLPSHVVGNKKIYLLGQDSKPILVNNKDETSSKKVVQLVPGGSRGNGIKSNALTLESSDKDSTKSTKAEPALKRAQLMKNKIICHNGTKYIIKQAQGSVKTLKNKSNAIKLSKESHESSQSKSTCSIPPLIPLKSAESDSLSIPDRVNALHADVSPLTPSPSPSELSSSSSCDTQSKQISLPSCKGVQKTETANTSSKVDQNMMERNCSDSGGSLSFHKGEDDNLYLDMKSHAQKPIYTIVDSAGMITKSKHEMLNEFFHLSYAELKKRYNHLQQLNDEIRAVMDFVPEGVVKESLKRVNILQLVLKQCMDKCNNKIDDGGVKDLPLEEWEEEYNRSGVKTLCKACEKPRKPESYMPGFSKTAKNDIYCSCYRHVCHKCETYQGNSTRFVAHQTFHDKEKPYLCPDCYRKFMVFTSLEAHTWTSCFHPLKKRVLGCKICEIDGFRDMETVARHFAVMHSHHKIACEKCNIVVPTYPDYQKHYKAKHPDASVPGQPIRLVLCKLGHCIVRCEEYMLHMEKHLVVQRLIWFTCPFCAFLHVEAKRIMSHLQNEHLSQLCEIISPQVLWNILPPELTATYVERPMSHKIEKPEDGTVMPKIVNTRTITSEVFERGTEESVECYLPVKESGLYPRALRNATKLTDFDNSLPKILEVRSIAERSGSESPMNGIAAESGTKKEKIIKVNDEDVLIEHVKVGSGSKAQKRKSEAGCNKRIDDTSRGTGVDSLTKADSQEEDEQTDVECEDNPVSLSKPPPLARIPQRFLEEEGAPTSPQTSKAGRVTMFSRSQKTSKQFYQRLALNGPTRTTETVLNFLCPLCNDLINTSWSMVSSHFEKKHSQCCKLIAVSPALVRMSPDFINGGYKDLLGNRKRKAETATTNVKRRRRWTPKKYSEGRTASFAGTGLCVTQETAEDSEGNFRCKKCDQRCTDMVNLREHIATAHRIRGRYLICLECGDNFVVAPSLQMHLKAFHAIDDPIAYMAKNTSYAPDSIDDLDVEGKAIEANQCHVCMAVFEDKAAVDKHLRVHGMAFLNRKRIEAQNAMKKPDKKNGTDEEKQQAAVVQNKTPARKGKPAEMILDKITATI